MRCVYMVPERTAIEFVPVCVFVCVCVWLSFVDEPRKTSPPHIYFRSSFVNKYKRIHTSTKAQYPIQNPRNRKKNQKNPDRSKQINFIFESLWILSISLVLHESSYILDILLWNKEVPCLCVLFVACTHFLFFARNIFYNVSFISFSFVVVETNDMATGRE